MTRPSRDFYQAHLDHVSQALWDRDWTEAVRYWTYPHVVRTREEVGTVETEAEMLRHSQSFRDGMAGLGATAYHRVCIAADRVADDPDRIVGRHRTFILRGGNYVVPPYVCEMVLIRHPGLWKAISVVVATGLTDLDATTRMLISRSGLARPASGPDRPIAKDLS